MPGPGARNILAALAEEARIAETAQIDSSYVKPHRCSGGAKRMARPVAKVGSSPGHWRLARDCLTTKSPCARRRSRRVEAMFRRLKDFRSVAPCYDKFARNYHSAVALAATVASAQSQRQ